MILPLLLAAVAFLALLPIVAPLLRGNRQAPGSAAYDQAVYRDQLNELDRDIARGLITPVEADTARLEIQRRLLAAGAQTERPARVGRSPLVAMLLFAFAAGGTVGAYMWMGAPTLPDVPFVARKAAVPDAASPHDPTLPDQMQQAADKLAAKLKANPNDTEGWLLYARTLSQMERWDAAEKAYAKAIDLGANTPDVLADHAETMVLVTNGTVTPAAEAAFQEVLKAEPTSPVAQYYLAVAAMQAGEPKKAIDAIQALAAQLPADSEARDRLTATLQQAARSAGIPTPDLAPGRPLSEQEKAEAAAAAMPDEQRQAMVRGMVAKLAAEQEKNPSNLDGWVQLGTSYAVLHQMDNAAAAFDKAAALRPGDVSIRMEEVRALLTDMQPNDKLPPRALAILRDVQKTNPEEPMVLWYLGLAAVQDGNLEEGRKMWTDLISRLPAGSQDAKLVQTALDATEKKK